MSAFTEHLGLAHPIIQAPMAGVQNAALAVAVTQSGALGSLPAAMLTPADLSTELRRLQAVVGATYNLNFFAHAQPALDVSAHARWLTALAPHYAGLGLDPTNVAPAAGRLPFGDEACALVEQFKPRVVSFHFGLPAPQLLSRVKATGAQVWSSATTVAEAKWLQANGADAVIAQGLEAGGHRGHFLSPDLSLQSGTMALLPQIRAAIRLPVIAAGGIADAAGVRAALALGASAIQVGTSFLACDEATTSALHRRALASADATHTQLTTLFSGRPARGIVNALMRSLGAQHPDAPAFPLATAAVAPLRAAAERQDSSDYTPLWCGQNPGGVASVSAAEMVRRLAGV